MSGQRITKEPAVRIELTTAPIPYRDSSSTLAPLPPSVAGGKQRRNGVETAPERAHLPNDRPMAAPGSDEARIEAFLVKRWCYREYKKALRSGRLVPGPCFAEGPDCRGKKGNGHHHDYRYPLDVVFCCLGHHVTLDRLRRAGHSLASAMVHVLLGGGGLIDTDPAPRHPAATAVRAE